jgi:DNA polymerase III alpha subunit
MITDKYGRQSYTEDDICSIYLTAPDRILTDVLTEAKIEFNSNLQLENIPRIKDYTALTIPVKQFDAENQSEWFIPDEYKTMDIASWVLSQCKVQAELQRAGEELLMFQERDLFPLLCYLKYLVDTMRKHKVVWGVGRGSSVSSYVLYLIGVHRINSLHYDLSIDEFLK